jgi:farnesyl diphosphate synthase
MEINTLINQNKLKFENYYKKLINKKLNKNSILSKAMKYGSMNGGKRIRPFLVSQSSKVVNLSPKYSMLISSCIESIHCYSLIHDDLPSMDDDDYRRGKLSTHKKFNEATAILAGDALHDLAFEILTSNLKGFEPKLSLKLLNYLTICTGYNGLAGGQSLDLQYENKNINQKKIIEMYQMKTAKLFEFSFASPFILCGEAEKRIIFSKKFGSLFGIIFQIVDDLIDETNNFKTIGKTPGKDRKQGKTTLQSIIGKEKILSQCEELVDNFIFKNKNEFLNNPFLKKLLYFNIDRLK